MAKDHKRLGDMLLEEKLISADDLQSAIEQQRKTGRLLGATLIEQGILTEDALVQLLHRQLHLPLVDLATAVIDEQAIQHVKEDLARKYLAMPYLMQGRRTLQIAMADPLNVAALEDLRFHSGLFIQPVLATPSSILEAIDRHYQIDESVNEVLDNIITADDEVEVATVEESEQPEAIDQMRAEAEGRPIVRLTNWLLHRAVEDRASDIHIEPQDGDLIVRVRVDGLLRELQRLPKWTQSAVVSRIKVLSNMDIAEKRQPQDGRLMVEIEGRRVDMRVSTLPVAHGEKVVIRIIDQANTRVALDDLGFLPDDLVRVKRYLGRPQGIVLVTGPTGSGKSTLLYSGLRHLQHETKNIVTVEDPVEFQLAGINQVQVDEKAKKTFPAALRAILRQDPDIIMIGEIRDRETAQIAFRAAVTGHLVISTLHTNDAASAVTRLVDLGLEPFMVASSLVGVVAMRLVRTLCPNCKEEYETDAGSLNRLMSGGMDGTVKLYRGRGCPSCKTTGYTGRTGIYEMFEVDETIRALLVGNASDSAIRHAAIEAGMRSMGEDGLKKVLAGRTTLEEVTRVVYLTDQPGKLCPACQTYLNHEYEYCPSCGEFVGEHCEHCRKRMNPAWQFCPACGQEGGGTSGRGHEGDGGSEHERRSGRGRIRRVS